MSDIIINSVYFLSGLFFLYFGGEWLVRGCVVLAHKFGLSPFLVSVVIIGFGTSAPELLVSLQAALGGTPEIALGNVMGSNICNILLILGVGGLLTVLDCSGSDVKRDTLALLGATVLLAALSFAGEINRVVGALFFLTLSSYLFYSFMVDKKRTAREKAAAQEHGAHLEQDHGVEDMTTPKAAGLTLLGLVVLVVGAKLLVTGAVNIAQKFGVSDAVIGLTLVALGTSLPELATSWVAARKNHGDVIIGNVLGSSLFNILAILGLTAVVTPIAYAGQLATQDIWVVLAVTIVLFVLILTRGKIQKIESAAFLVCYSAYIVWLL